METVPFKNMGKQEFEILINGNTRRVKRAGIGSMDVIAGTLVFTDCVPPMSNTLVNEKYITSWKKIS